MRIRQHLVLIFVFICMMLCIGITASADSGKAIAINSEPIITINQGEYVFDIKLDGFSGGNTYTADAVVATYDAYDKTIAVNSGEISPYGFATVSVPVNGDEVSYKIMVLDRFTKLKPLCSAKQGKLSQDTIQPNYGYILQSAMVETPFNGEILQVKLLTKDGVMIYDLTEDASDMFYSIYEDYDISWEITADKNRFIVYSTDSLAKISSLKTAEENEGYFEEINGEYNGIANAFDGINLEDNAKIFMINQEIDDNVTVLDVSEMADGSIYNGLVYINSEGKASSVIIDDVSYIISENSNLAIVSSVKYKQDDQYNEIIEIEYYEKEEKRTAVLNDYTNIHSKRYIDSYDTAVGSIFVIFEKKDGVIREALHVGNVEEKVFVPDSITDEFLSDVSFVYGYIANEYMTMSGAGEILTVSNGEEEIRVVISRYLDTYKYTYDDTLTIPCIQTGDFLATDNTYYYDEENDTATPVLIMLNESYYVTNICAFNTPVNAKDMSVSDKVSDLGNSNTKYMGETVSLNSFDIINKGEDNQTIVYYSESANHSSNSISKILIDIDAELYINNSVYDKFEYKDFDVASFWNMVSEYEQDFEIILEDTNSDKKYDIIRADIYEYGLIDSVDTKRLSFIFNGRRVTLDDEDVEIEIMDSDGNQLSLEDLKAGDFVAVLSDPIASFTIYDYLRVVKINDYTEGTVDALWESSEFSYYEINGKSYINNSYQDLILRDSGIFYTNISGNVIYAFKSSEKYSYGYILESAKKDAVFGGDKWQVKLLTEDGVVIYDMTQNASDEFHREWDGEEIIWEKGIIDWNRILCFKIDSSENIRYFAHVSEVGDTLEISGTYRASTKRIGGGYVVEDYTKVFMINEESADMTYVTDPSVLLDRAEYDTILYIDEDGIERALIIGEVVINE